MDFLSALDAAVTKRPRLAVLGFAAANLAYREDDAEVRLAASRVLKNMLKLRPSLFTAMSIGAEN